MRALLRMRAAPVEGAPTHTYEVLGDLRYVSWDAEVIPDNPGLGGKRLRRLESLMLSPLGLQRIGDDHRIDCGYWYMDVLRAVGVCTPE